MVGDIIFINNTRQGYFAIAGLLENNAGVMKITLGVLKITLGVLGNAFMRVDNSMNVRSKKSYCSAIKALTRRPQNLN